MESRSDISSLSSKRSLENNIPSIHIDQYLLDEHAKKISSLHQSQINHFPRIFTVAQTLKDPLILNHIKPDYGSLGEFIGDLNIGRDLLNQKKRKNQGNEEEAEQKKIKGVFKQKTQQQLNNAFLSKSSSNIYKRVAGKLLVENLFKQSFGVSLNAFETQNVKQQATKNFKFNLAYFDQIFQGKKDIIKKMDQLSESNQKMIGSVTQRLQQEKVQTKEYKILTLNQRHEIVNQVKSKYQTLRRLEIRQQCQQYRKLKPKQQHLHESWPQNNFHYQVEQKKAKQKQNQNSILQINQNSIHLQKLTIKPQLAIFLMSQFPLEKIQSIFLNQVRIHEQALCFMIEVITQMCLGLQKLTIRCTSVEKLQNLAVKIKQLLQKITLKQLVLEYIDFETKQFCIICLGLGSNISLEVLSFDNNSIDERACKSLQLISKHCTSLKKIYLRKNYVKPHHLSYFTAEAKAKIIL